MRKNENINKSEFYCKCGKFLAFRNGERYKTPKGVNVIIENLKITVICSCGEKTILRK